MAITLPIRSLPPGAVVRVLDKALNYSIGRPLVVLLGIYWQELARDDFTDSCPRLPIFKPFSEYIWFRPRWDDWQAHEVGDEWRGQNPAYMTRDR